MKAKLGRTTVTCHWNVAEFIQTSLKISCSMKLETLLFSVYFTLTRKVLVQIFQKAFWNYYCSIIRSKRRRRRRRNLIQPHVISRCLTLSLVDLFILSSLPFQFDWFLCSFITLSSEHNVKVSSSRFTALFITKMCSEVCHFCFERRIASSV